MVRHIEGLCWPLTLICIAAGLFTVIAPFDVPAVRRLMRSIEADKRTNSRNRKLGGPGAARKAVRVLSSLMTWAVGEGRLERNPIIGNLRLTGDNQRETIIGAPEEYVRLYAAMDDLVASGDLRPMVRAFIVVAALTGARRGELRGCAGAMSISKPDGSRCAGRRAPSSPRRDRSSSSWACPGGRSMPSLPSPEDALPNDLVFVPVRGNKMSVNRDWNRIRDAAKLPADLTLHGLRHSVGTAAVIAGLSLPEVQKLLRHRSPTMTSRYIHLASDRRISRTVPHIARQPGR
jgi:Site-specific recombinase XerD